MYLVLEITCDGLMIIRILTNYWIIFLASLGQYDNMTCNVAFSFVFNNTVLLYC